MASELNILDDHYPPLKKDESNECTDAWNENEISSRAFSTVRVLRFLCSVGLTEKIPNSKASGEVRDTFTAFRVPLTSCQCF